MKDDEMMKLVEQSGTAILNILAGKNITVDDMTTFWAALVGNVSEIIYRKNPEAYPWAACMITSRKLGVVALELKEIL